MSKWTFLDLARPPSNAGEAQQIARPIEESISLAIKDDITPGGNSIICIQPVEGSHSRASTNKAASYR